MSLDYYGIFIAYPPTVDLRCEGLGRQLAAFIKGAAEKDNVRFVLVCPSWSKKMLADLLHSEGINNDVIDICHPKGQNILVMLNEVHQYIRKKSKKNEKTNLLSRMQVFWISLEKKLLNKLLTARNIFSFIFYFFVTVPFIISNGLILLQHYLIRFIGQICSSKMKIFWKKITSIFGPMSFKEIFPLADLYQYVEAREMQLMLHLINDMDNVKAWYSPTAFWPGFNQIKAPKLLCVPDVVLTEFPVGFCSIKGGDRHLHTFNKVEQTIRDGEYYVTYSQHIKDSVLVERYNIDPENVKVIPHSANTLDHFVTIQGYTATDQSTRRYCQQLFMSALMKSTNHSYTKLIKNSELKFFFYASQFRPSKNVITLLRAYKFLLRNRFIRHKLILTGRPGVMSDIDSYITNNHLERDVILVPNLKIEELAACYQLADLVINPSLSEGGCPFTFTESLSVNTPVIMANIPVTTEIITDQQLQEMMLFDPYNWENLVSKMEWALQHRDQLLDRQIIFYNKLKERSWTDVVNEHIDMLEFIASNPKAEVNAAKPQQISESVKTKNKLIVEEV